jgi:hypothetical protein
VPGTLTVWADVLHDGPVPPDDDVDDWFRVRAEFVARCGWESEADALAHYRAWQAGLDAYRDHDEVVLWFEHDLFDQLLLVRHLSWFARQQPGATRLALICIGSYPGVEHFHGLGQLTPEQLGPLLDTRQAVTNEQLELGRATWRAFTSDDPARLEGLLDRDTSALPFLAGALRRLLEEYPAATNGLARTERQILEILTDGERTPAALFVANYQKEERVFMGDAAFWQCVLRLARGVRPLVSLEAARPNATAREPAHRFRADGAIIATVRITGAGRAVLESRADRVRIAGIDRWIGGVHLQGGDVDWRWDASRGRLARASA